MKPNNHTDRELKYHNRNRYESHSDSDDSTEKQRLRDLQERDEFADRLKKKDKEKTRNVAQPAGSGEYLLIFKIKQKDSEYTKSVGLKMWILITFQRNGFMKKQPSD
jgi:pre-mRNA-splicing factor ATP-dependent RNA helicase DHX16